MHGHLFTIEESTWSPGPPPPGVSGSWAGQEPPRRYLVEKILLLLLLAVGIAATVIAISALDPKGRDRHWEAFEAKLARFDQYPKLITFLKDDEEVRQALCDGEPIRIVAVNRITGEVLLPDDPAGGGAGQVFTKGALP